MANSSDHEENDDVAGIDEAYVEVGLEEEGLDLNAEKEEAEVAESIDESTISDLVILAEKAETSSREVKVGNQKFLLVADVLLPCPPRGQFDVERIRDSLYFFS